MSIFSYEYFLNSLKDFIFISEDNEHFGEFHYFIILFIKSCFTYFMCAFITFSLYTFLKHYYVFYTKFSTKEKFLENSLKKKKK